MSDVCSHCKRPIWPVSDMFDYGHTKCWHPGSRECAGYAAGRLAGIDEGVRLAKKYVVTRHMYKWPDGEWTESDWTGVDKAVVAAKGVDHVRPCT